MAKNTSKSIDWDHYFMNIAKEVAKKSKDPSSQNGCIIVDPEHRPVSFGYNGLIQGADETKMTLSDRPMKYYFSVHSEMNALIFAKRDVRGCTIYNTIATCDNCLKHCLQAGIKRFVYEKLRVNSFSTAHQASMTNFETDTAIVRMLSAMPEISTLNLTNGKTYIEDILDQYHSTPDLQNQLKSWL